MENYKNKIIDYALEFRRRENHLINFVNAKLRHNSVNSYWYEDVVNFGDLLTPLLLKAFGLSTLHTPKQEADLLSIGSILQDLNEDFSGCIAGSGLIHDKKLSLPRAKILALRGKLTRDRIGAPQNTILGDPGLLIEKLKYRRQKKQFLIGLVPHFVDKKDERILRLKNSFPNDICVINVQRYPREVIQEIDRCAYILSSSLHGVVTADALGIPNGWFRCKEETIGTFKFFDYASAIDKQITPHQLTGSESIHNLINMTGKVSSKIDEVKYQLEQVYSTLANEILNHII